MTEELAVALGRLLDASVTDLVRLTGGASRDTWSVTVEDGRRFVLQRQATGAASATRQAGGIDMAGEAALVRAAHRAGVPTAEVLASSGDDGRPDGLDPLGAGWMVVAHVEGETIARRLLRDDEWATARDRLLGQVAAAAATVHRIDRAEAAGVLPPADDPIERYRDALDLLGEPHPAFELGLRWLDQHRPRAGTAPTVVHGDFRLGNWIVGPDGLRAVIDWELAHLGDPAEDLGWLCVRAWRFGAAPPAAGLGSREQLLDAYAAAGGRAITLDELRWWEAFGTMAWGVMCIAQAARHRSGDTRSVELAAIGRRACENEWDLLALLPGGAVEPPAPTAEAFPAAPHDQPTAPELLDAVGSFLHEDVMVATDGAVRFHARVAANVVDQVRRQFELGAGHARAHTARLEALGHPSDTALATAIRAGALDDRFDEVRSSLMGSALDKLAVAHPGYAESI